MKRLRSWIWLFILLANCSFSFGKDQLNENIVKIYTTYNEHNYYDPWQMKGHETSEGSGCIIKDNLILTNAHVVSNHTFIAVKRSGQTKKYVAKVRFIGHECDLAVLEVRDRKFYPEVPPLEIGRLPMVTDEVSVYGYPSHAEQLTITKGIVSRVDHDNYRHSHINLLTCQIDAAINPGNSGGPVIAGGKIVGIAMMTSWGGENEGFMVPVPVIQHFLEDIEDGSYDGIPDLAISIQSMENPQMREFFGMESEQTGILVRKVYPLSPCKNILKPGDVIISIDGTDIANDGTISFREGERTSYTYTIQNKYIGDTVSVQILRGGKIYNLTVKLSIPSASYRLVPFEQYGVEPVYYIYGGFIFSPLTENLIKEFGDDWWSETPWWSEAPLNFLYVAYYGQPTDVQKEVVVIVDVLSDEINIGYEDLYHEIVAYVNGKKIGSMDDLVNAIESNRKAYHIIITDTEKQIILDRKMANKSTKRILKTYNINKDRSENLRMKTYNIYTDIK